MFIVGSRHVGINAFGGDARLAVLATQGMKRGM